MLFAPKPMADPIPAYKSGTSISERTGPCATKSLSSGDASGKKQTSVLAVKEIQNKQWEMMFAELSKCKNANTNRPKLLRWIDVQRSRYCSTIMNQGRTTGLSEERIQRLQSIGINLDPQGRCTSSMVDKEMHEVPGSNADDFSAVEVLAAQSGGSVKVSKPCPPLNSDELSLAAKGSRTGTLKWVPPAVLTGATPNALPQTTSCLEVKDFFAGDATRLPSLEASFWVLPEGRQKYCCSFSNSDKGCIQGNRCRYIHVQIPWGKRRMEELWLECDQQLPPHVEKDYHERVLCVTAYAAATKWFTARYSSESPNVSDLDHKIIFAEGGSSAYLSDQRISWYPTENAAIKALRRAVIVTYYSTAQGIISTAYPTGLALDVVRKKVVDEKSSEHYERAIERKRFSSDDLSASHDGGHLLHPLYDKRLYSQYPATMNMELMRKSDADSHIITPGNGRHHGRETSVSLAAKRHRGDPWQDLPRLGLQWIKKQTNGVRYGKDCQLFRRDNYCVHGPSCNDFHILKSSVAAPSSVELRQNHFPGNRTDIKACIKFYEKMGPTGLCFYTAAYRYGNFIVLAEQGNGMMQCDGETWWYLAKADARDAVYKRIRQFL